jgi:nucleoside phosphorylase
MEPLECDTLLFIATSEEEKQTQAIAKELGIELHKGKYDGVTFFNLGTVGFTRLVAVKMEMGSLEYYGSAANGFRFMTCTGATGIVQVGMAFGVNDEAQIVGDVLVSSSIVPYDKRHVQNAPPGSGKPYIVDYSDAVRKIASQSLLDMFSRGADAPEGGYRVFFGSILSGAARISSRTFRDELVRGVPGGNDEIIGREMEAVGLLSVSEPESPN